MRRLLCVCVLSSTVWAQPSPAPNATPLAVVPFTGLHADEPQSVVVKMLKRRAQLIPAGDLGKTSAQVVITGTVEHPEGKLQLVVSALSLKSGDVVGQLNFPIPKTRHLTREQLHDLATKVNTLADQAILKVTGESYPLAAAPTEEEIEAAVAQAGDTEHVPLDINDLTQAQARGDVRRAFPPRPRWAPLLDANLGVIIAGRSLSFSPSPASNYQPGSGGGIHVDATLYPLAFFHEKAKGVLAGLGAGATLDVPFWPTTEAQRDNPGAPGEYATHELRVEGGARWKFTLYKKIPRFELTALLGAGLHSYTVGRLVNKTSGTITDVGPPNVAYVFGAFGVQARVHFKEYGSVWAAFSYEYVPDAGHVEDAAEYGYANTWGLHLRGGLDLYVFKGLKVGASAYWERFALSFTHGSPTPFKTASSAVDNYYGGIITVGYTL